MRRKKRTLTLMEIMIVIVLIGLIGSVIGINMKGSLDKGRAFKTKEAIRQIDDIFSLEIARGTSAEYILGHQADILKSSGLVKNPEKFLRDGWGVPFKITLDGRTTDRFIITSDKYDAYKVAHNIDEDQE